MLSRKELIDYCLTFSNVYENYPFDGDSNWVAMRLKESKKCFVFIYERNNLLCINAKCEPMYAEFLRQVHSWIQPAYHMNKKHWNTLIVNDASSDDEIFSLINHAKSLVEPKLKINIKQGE